MFLSEHPQMLNHTLDSLIIRYKHLSTLMIGQWNKMYFTKCTCFGERTKFKAFVKTRLKIYRRHHLIWCWIIVTSCIEVFTSPCSFIKSDEQLNPIYIIFQLQHSKGFEVAGKWFFTMLKTLIWLDLNRFLGWKYALLIFSMWPKNAVASSF